VRQFSVVIGAAELIIATLITLRHWSPRACAIGSAGAVLMFVTTLTFLFSTPGWEPTLGGFPALSHGVGEFLIKDVVLLGAALWSLAESLASIIHPLSSCASDLEVSGVRIPRFGEHSSSRSHA
jgi:reactive chlorine resistance protein C